MIYCGGRGGWGWGRGVISIRNEGQQRFDFKFLVSHYFYNVYFCKLQPYMIYTWWAHYVFKTYVQSFFPLEHCCNMFNVLFSDSIRELPCNSVWYFLWYVSCCGYTTGKSSAHSWTKSCVFMLIQLDLNWQRSCIVSVEEGLPILLMQPHMPPIRSGGKWRSKLTLLRPCQKHQKTEIQIWQSKY